jgi:hypothetical protein
MALNQEMHSLHFSQSDFFANGMDGYEGANKALLHHYSLSSLSLSNALYPILIIQSSLYTHLYSETERQSRGSPRHKWPTLDTSTHLLTHDYLVVGSARERESKKRSRRR